MNLISQPAPSPLPKIVRVVEPFERFFKKIVRGSYPIFIAAVAALIWANFSTESYQHLWHTEITFSFGTISITKSFLHWIDEALMTLFFFTVGLEIKREILVGELASFKKALLPIAAALGGMILPALIYTALNYGTPEARGWGIPMATDIAFSLAVLAVIGRKIPLGLRIFLSAFAIADDLGAVLVIALFYTQGIVWNYLLLSALFVMAIALANLLWIRYTLVYALLGVGLWITILVSGIHATVAGVLVAMFIPAKGRYDTDTFLTKAKAHLDKFECEPGSCGYTILLNQRHLNAVQELEQACHDVETPLQRLEYNLESWISILILPLFALANAGLVLKGFRISDTVNNPVTLGIILGLVIGKPLGITCFTFLASKAFRAPLPSGVDWKNIIGARILGGIGFTMSLFISGLCFPSTANLDQAKLGILVASLFSGILGFMVLGLSNSTGLFKKLP